MVTGFFYDQQPGWLKINRWNLIESVMLSNRQLKNFATFFSVESRHLEHVAAKEDFSKKLSLYRSKMPGVGFGKTTPPHYYKLLNMRVFLRLVSPKDPVSFKVTIFSRFCDQFYDLITPPPCFCSYSYSLSIVLSHVCNLLISLVLHSDAALDQCKPM